MGASFVRIVTNPRIFDDAMEAGAAVAFIDALRTSVAYVHRQPGLSTWDAFRRLCALPGVRGDVTPDAYLAALAIDLDAELVTADRGFARFPGLRWRHPLD